MASPGDAVAGTVLSQRTEHALDLFVIHAEDDRDFVRGYLLPALNLPAQRVLLTDDLDLGAGLIAEIERGVSSSRCTVAVLSPAYLQDRWAVYGEQLASHVSVEGVRVIPLRLVEVELPLRLEARIALDFTQEGRWESETARLRGMLHTAAPATEPLPCPYPGMRAFTEHEASRFFGRSKEIHELIQLLDQGEREIYAIGPSGSGKSSLVQAGLLYVLESGLSRLGRSFLVRVMRPGQRPTDRLAQLIEGDLARAAESIDHLLARHGPATRVLLIIDQAEELFTLAAAAERQRFISALRAFGASSPCHFLLALRADFYGAFMDSELWPDGATPARIDVVPLRGTTLAQAIIEPAAQVGVHLERRLCDRLVSDAAIEPGALPHVQETLRLLWDRRRHRLLGISDYEALGGDDGRGLDVAIAQRIDSTLRNFTTAQQTIARRVLLRLVVFGEGRADTRRQQEVRALRSAMDDPAEFSHVLQRLVDDRLITVGGNAQADTALADLSHEALITASRQFREWLVQMREHEQRRRRLELQVAAWIERGSGRTGLLDPAELAETVQWMHCAAASELGYGPELPAFVTASRREFDKARQQRRWHTVRTLAILGLAGLLGFVALQEWRRARRREDAQRLLAAGQEYIDDHPMEALPCLIAAHAQGIKTLELRRLVAQATSAAPLVTLIDGDVIDDPGTSPHTRRVTITAAAFSPDSTHVVTTSDDGAARIWDARTGRPVGSPLKHPYDVAVAAEFSADGQQVVTTSGDRRRQESEVLSVLGRPLQGQADAAPRIERRQAHKSDTTTIWDVTTGKPINQLLEHRDPIVAAVFSPDRVRMATISVQGPAQLWDVMMARPIGRPLEHRDPITEAAFSPDGTRLVTVSHGRTASVWDATTGTRVTDLFDHPAPVVAAALNRDGTQVITASDDVVRVWDVSTGKLVTPPFKHTGHVVAVAFSPDSKRFVARTDKMAMVWRIESRDSVSITHQRHVVAVAFSPDGTRVVTASDDQTARVWDAMTGAPVTPPFDHPDRVTAAGFSADGQRVITLSGGVARIWAATAGRPASLPLEHRGPVTAAAFSPDGRYVITASGDGTAQIWDVNDGKAMMTPPLQHQGHVTAAAFTATGCHLVASTGKTAQVWDATTRKPMPLRLGHRDEIALMVFSNDGARVFTASVDGVGQIWSATTGEPTGPALQHPKSIVAATFSPDGTRVVTGSSDGKARVWDAGHSMQLTPPLEHQDEITAVAFSPDGTRVATASCDHTARVWNAETGAQVTPALEHDDCVTAIAFSPGGTRVVTASRDTTARVWDAATGKPVTRPLEHRYGVTAATFSPSSAWVMTVSDGNAARVWDAETGEPLAELKHQGSVTLASFSPDGSRAVTASRDNTARIWDLSGVLGSDEEWKQLLSCTPFTLVDGKPSPNLDPARTCPTTLARPQRMPDLR